MSNPNHDLDLVAFGYSISKYLSTLPNHEAMEIIKRGYSKEALESLYDIALEQEDYRVCSILKEVLACK